MSAIDKAFLASCVETALQWGGLSLKAFLLFTIGWTLSEFLLQRVSASLKKTSIETTVRRLLQSILKALLKTGVIVLVLNIFGIKMTVLAAVLGGVSISLGLALKNNISHVANGILLIINKPFIVGDYIESGSISGTIERVDLFNTTLKTPGNQHIIVPNTQLTNHALTNFNANPTRRIDLTLGLSYNDNLSNAIPQLKGALQQTEGVLAEEEIQIWLTDFGDSSINMSIRAWCNRPDFLAVRHRLILGIKEFCDTHGYTIPYPQRDLHILNQVLNTADKK